MYKQVKSFDDTVSTTLFQRIADGAFIPADPDNTDYQAYLKWVAEGNVPLAAETNTPLPAENA
jgi:hypothetical protein